MILVRDIFHLKFGKARDAVSSLKEARDLNKKYGFDKTRALTDLVTGQSYTLVLESEWNDLASWEGSMKQGLGADEWQIRVPARRRPGLAGRDEGRDRHVPHRTFALADA